MKRLLACFFSIIASLGADLASAFEAPYSHRIDLNSPPGWFPREGSKNPSSSPEPYSRTIPGRLSSTRERAFADARKRLDDAVATWLVDSGLPKHWNPPRRLIDRMILDRHCEPVRRELGIEGAEAYETLYRAAFLVDFSPNRLSPFFDENHREIERRDLRRFGGGLGFVLACLATFVAYAKADDASKGYYTKFLRLIAIGTVAAAGTAIIRWTA